MGERAVHFRQDDQRQIGDGRDEACVPRSVDQSNGKLPEHGTCILYDAFGREAERGVNGAYTEVMYTPAGKTAIMNGQTTTLNAYFPLPGGATLYGSCGTCGTFYLWHKDWLGSVRLASTFGNRTPYFDRAFAPFGEMYDNFGSTTGLDFTGDTQDSFAGLLYDTPNRELHPGQGRWLSPDPSGLDAVDPSNPQSWNRYAYVRNNPLSLTDPTGLDFYLKCTSSDNSGCVQVQIDPNNANSNTWVQADSNKNAIVITSDSIRAGQNTATVDENGVQINGRNQGVYFDNPASHTADADGNDVNNNPLNVAGSGKLQDFNFHIDSNCGGTCWTAGEWSFSGRSYSGISGLLDRRGAFTLAGDYAAYLGYGAHPYTTQHRFSNGSCSTTSAYSCPNSPHLSVPYDQPGMFPTDPLLNVPRSGGFHVDPNGDYVGHTQDLLRGGVPD
jgi:RHS repeat-associated protein